MTKDFVHVYNYHMGQKSSSTNTRRGFYNNHKPQQSTWTRLWMYYSQRQNQPHALHTNSMSWLPNNSPKVAQDMIVSHAPTPLVQSSTYWIAPLQPTQQAQ